MVLSNSLNVQYEEDLKKAQIEWVYCINDLNLIYYITTLEEGMIGRNFFRKMLKNFLNTMQNTRLKIPNRYRKIDKKPKWFHSSFQTLIEQFWKQPKDPAKYCRYCTRPERTLSLSTIHLWHQWPCLFKIHWTFVRIKPISK